MALKKAFAFVSVAVSAALMSCTALYPRFDNPLNPDIMFLNAGDVVDSVKCAVTSYLLERASELQGAATHLLHTEFTAKRGRNISDRSACPPGRENWAEPKAWRIALMSPVADKDGKKKCKEASYFNPPTVPTTIDEIEEWDGLRNCRPAFKAYKYVTLVKLSDGDDPPKFRCRPNGGCKPGTYPTRNGACAMDDESRLALDPNSNTKIELTLSALNSGSMNYNRIDADRLDLRSIIVPGGGVNPFPMFKGTDKNTNKVSLTVLLAQNTLEAEDVNDGRTKAIIEMLEKKVKAQRPPASVDIFSDAIQLNVPIASPEFFAEKSYQELLKDPDHKGFKEQCGLLKIDFLALKRYIRRVIEDQDKRIHRGAPNLSMESFVLTSEFQISLDASAGTKNILRILPVLAAPTLGLVSDHTHTLKMTFNGAKSRALPTNTFSLRLKCLERVTGAGVSSSQDPETFCSSPQALQLESLIDAVESNTKGGG